MDYFTHMQRRLDNEEYFVPAALGNKEYVRQFADMLGIWTPTVYFRGPASEIPWKSMPTEFVLKPAFASTSIGVFLLRNLGEGTYENLVTATKFSQEQILEKCAEVSTRFYSDSAKGAYIVEELLRDQAGHIPPADIRFYAFQGEIGMILKEEHLSTPVESMYFDGEFLPFSDIDNRYSVAPALAHLERIVDAVPPNNWEELLTVAKRISVAIPSAFCRIDLYNTPERIYLGELTFYPGTFYYRNRKLMSPAEAERLGRMWDSAETRLTGSRDSESLKQPFTLGPTA